MRKVQIIRERKLTYQVNCHHNFMEMQKLLFLFKTLHLMCNFSWDIFFFNSNETFSFLINHNRSSFFFKVENFLIMLNDVNSLKNVLKITFMLFYCN